MALEGTLRDFSLSDIFQLIALQRKTGILSLSGREDVVTISFLDGKVVNADSKKRGLDSQLGNVLLKRGALTEEKLKEALSLQAQTLQRLGYILIKEKIITRDELREALTQQILEIIYKVFRWRDGDYHFSQETTIEFDRESIIPLTAENILMEGAQMMDEWPILERKIPSRDIVFLKTPIDQEVVEQEEEEDAGFDFNFSDEPASAEPVGGDIIQLPPQVFYIYGLIDGRRTVVDIVEMSRTNEFETYKGLYELIGRNLVQQAEVEEPVEREAEEEIEEVMEEQRPVMLPLIVVAILVFAGFFFRPINPLNSDRSFIGGVGAHDEILYTVSMSRVIHLEKAMAVYAVDHLKYPENLDQFLNEALATPSTLVDPWGRVYTYLHEKNNYYLYGFLPDGTRSLELLTSHPEFGGEADGRVEEEKEPHVKILE